MPGSFLKRVSKHQTLIRRQVMAHGLTVAVNQHYFDAIRSLILRLQNYTELLAFKYRQAHELTMAGRTGFAPVVSCVTGRRFWLG